MKHCIRTIATMPGLSVTQRNDRRAASIAAAITRVLRDTAGILEAATIVCRVFDVLAELAELRPDKAVYSRVSTASYGTFTSTAVPYAACVGGATVRLLLPYKRARQ